MTPPSATSDVQAGLSDAARALLDRRAAHRVEHGDRIPPRDDAAVAPLSAYQQPLWLFDQMHPASAAYNRPRAFRIVGPLDVAALERALGAVLDRHHVLRSALLLEDGIPVQRVRHSEFTLPVTDLRALDPETRAARHGELVREHARRPFDLADGALIRAALVRLDDAECTLVITLHHAASDGWSDAVLYREIGTAYAAFVAGEEPSLPHLALQYGDYAAWQRNRLTSGSLTSDVAYWTERLADVPASLDLPTDRPRSAEPSFDGSTRTLHIDAAHSDALGTVAREEKATLAMALLAVYELLLSRYSAQTDFVVGVPIAGRTRPELEPLIGFFSNTLPLRADLSGDPSFRELLRRVRTASLEAYAHQDVPVGTIIDALRARGAGIDQTATMVQVMLNVRNTPPAALSLMGLAIEPIRMDGARAVVDLNVEITERADGLECVAEFATALFDDSTVDRMLAHCARLVACAVATPDAPISRLPILSEAERDRALRAWNATGRALGADTTLHALVDAQAARTPGATAVSDDLQSLTYAELVRRAAVLAYELQARGVGPGALVGVCMERSVHLVIALLATLKAGAAYVPLDPAFPADRLSFLLDDARPTLLLADAASTARIPPSDVTRIVVDEIRWDAEATDSPRSLATPDDLAYVIYTSGSTGRPKGVLNTHRGIANRVLWMQTECPLGADDAVLQKTPFSFDVSVPEIFAPLAFGARLVMARPDGHLDDAYLARIIDGAAISSVHFVPSMLHGFLDAAALGVGRTLRYVFCSGEALPLPVARAVAGRFPQARLYNLYGPTEAAVEVSYSRFDPWSTRTVVPMGRPIANVRLYVLDARMQPVPPGVAGELYIGGVAVARGYLNRPELTAERFVRDPFTSDANARLYRTGDVVRQDADGVIEYIGRTDHQVKIQGVRIECGEIESVLAEHERVRECLVSAAEISPGERRLVAYVVPHGGRDAVDDHALRDFLRTRLPEVLVPAAFVRLDTFPLTSSGKTDRRALPTPVFGAEAPRPAYRTPRTPTEVMLARLWADALGVERVGAYDDFFTLGGNSLAAARIAGRLRALLGVTIPIRAIFEHPTIAQLAPVVAAKDDVPIEPMVCMQRGDPALTPLFLLHGDFNGGGLYCRALVQHLGSSRPVFTLYPHEPGSRDSIEEMAADYVERIMRTSSGPYLLAGYCNGADVAYEIACRLRERGEDVKLVALIDAAAPHRVLALLHRVVHGGARIAGVDAERAREIYCRARDHVFQLSDLLPPRDSRASMPEWLVSAGKILRAMTDIATQYAARRLAPASDRSQAVAPVADPIAEAEAAGIFNQRWLWYVMRVRDYSPRRFDGRVTLIQPSARVRRRTEDATFNWSRVARDVDLHVLPGTHLTIVGDGLDLLGATLRASIEAAERTY